MAPTPEQKFDYRNLASNPLARAFVISFLLHLAALGTVELGRKAGLWEKSLLPRWMASPQAPDKKTVAEKKRQQVQLPEMERDMEIPLVFMEVDPNEAVKEAPKNAKFYSAANTLAANPNPKNQEIPQIQGKQEFVPKAFDVLRPTAEPLKPALPKPEPTPDQPAPPQPKLETQLRPKEERDEEPEKPEQPPPEGDLLVSKSPQLDAKDPVQLAKAENLIRKPPTEPEPPQTKPRTLAEAKARKGIIPGEKSKQEGGVNRTALESSADTRATAFGAYDAAFIAAVQARWDALLEERDFVRSQMGKVVLSFRLNKDGRITQMEVVESEVSDTLGWLCQRAVLDPAPYKPFPPDALAEMQRMTRKEHREIRFTFYYNQ